MTSSGFRAAEATRVAETTDGVAPVGHPSPLRTIVDTDLAQFDEVWAAGGHPHYVFPTSFDELVRITGGTPADVGAELTPRAQSVVAASLQDDEVPVGDQVDQPVLVVNPARPASGKITHQRLGLADSLARIARSLGEHAVDALQNLAVVRPTGVVSPTTSREPDHSSMSGWAANSPR